MSNLLQYLALIPLCISSFMCFNVFRRTQYRNGASDSRRLLTAVKFVLQPPNAPLRQILEERAHANRRLVRALKLTNTFVSGDETLHKEFVSRAQRLLNNAQGKGWPHFQSVARDAIQWQLASSITGGKKSGACFQFNTNIQNITLFVILVGLLGIDTAPTDILYDDVSVVTHHITKLWVLSKSSKPIPPTMLEQLNERLRRLVPDADAFSAPLDLVVPAWETMWRVVATTVAYANNSFDVQEAFTIFNACPTDETFRKDAQGAGVTIKNFVAEAMRLHPPSKRISRSKESRWWPAFLGRWVPRMIIKADVEALLMNRELWGASCYEFVPGRHNPGTILPEQLEAQLLTFGHGKLRCIASSWAPMAAAVIAGTILEEYIVVSGKTIGEREGWKGWALTRKFADHGVHSTGSVKAS